MADKDTNDITKLKVDTEVLKSQITSICALCQKMDKVIDRIVDNMEERTKSVNEEFREVNKRIDTVLDKVTITELRIMEEIKSLRKEMNENMKDEQTSIDKLFEWKWMVAGGIIVLSWLTSHLDSDIIKKLFE